MFKKTFFLNVDLFPSVALWGFLDEEVCLERLGNLSKVTQREATEPELPDFCSNAVSQAPAPFVWQSDSGAQRGPLPNALDMWMLP